MVAAKRSYPVLKVIDEPTDENIEHMDETIEVKLTEKREMFSRYIVDDMSYTDAYIMAYRPLNWQRGNICTAASRLRQDEKVSARIAFLRTQKEHLDKKTPDNVRKEIKRELHHMAVHGSTESTRLKAMEMLGKAGDIGLFVEQIDIGNKDRNPEDIEKELTTKISALLKGKRDVMEEEVNSVDDLF